MYGKQKIVNNFRKTGAVVFVRNVDGFRIAALYTPFKKPRHLRDQKKRSFYLFGIR